MSSYAFACQTITFGSEQSQFLDRVFAAVAAAGYDGLEVGYRHVAHLAPTDLRAKLDSHGTRMIATHLGGNLEDFDQARNERGLLQQALDAAPVVGFDLIFYSGLRCITDAELDRDLAMLNRAARAAAAAGVTLCYHNHDWEFRDGARIFQRLLRDAAPELKLVPDLGWLYRGGQDLIGFLQRHRERIGAIHFKNYTLQAGFQMEFATLGDGLAPLGEAAKWLRDNPLPITWLIAEQDQAINGMSPEATITANAQFLRRSVA